MGRKYLGKLSGLSLVALSTALWSVEAAAQTANTVKTEEVVITGQRASTVAAIEAQRLSDSVVSVVSADDLGKLPDANIADAVARLPGVNVTVNQETGEGESLTARGFASTYNVYTINGIRIANTDPDSRGVSLTVLPPNGLQSVSVIKTLTPDLDGDAIGALFDIKTPTAFNQSKDVSRLIGAYGYNDRARSQNEPDSTKGLEAQFSRKFGGGRWGLFADAYWQSSHGINEETENDGEWEPYKFRLNSEEAIDARSMYLPGIDLDYRRVEQQRFGGNFSVDYRGDDTQLFLRGLIARFERTENNNYTDFRTRTARRLVQKNVDSTTLLQPDAAVTGVGAKGRIYSYTTGQIVDADGDGVITDADRTTRSYWSLFGRSGVWDPQAMQFARSMETQDLNQTIAAIDAGGKSTLGRLQLTYDVSYSYGLKEDPNHFAVGYNCDRCGILGTVGVLWSSYDPRFPLPQLKPQVADVERRDDYLGFDGAGWDRWRQTDKRTGLKFDAKYDLDGTLDALMAGVKVQQSKRDYDRTPVWGGDLLGVAATTLDKSGLVERQLTSMLDGRYYYGSLLSRSKVVNAIKAAAKASPSGNTIDDLNGDDKRSQEDVYAGYVRADFRVDALQVITGLRVEHTKVSNDAWDGDVKHKFVTTKSDDTQVLPSVTAIWRPTDSHVLRGAIWKSFTRPEYSNMFSGERVTRNAAGEVVSRFIGSPDLKPVQSTNFDLIAEWYPDRSSVLSVGAYLKKMQNFQLTNGNTQEASTSVGFVQITQVKNGGSADIHGVEINVIKDFDGLAAPFDGFGVSANVTLQKGKAEPGPGYRAGKKIPFIGQPEQLYNASINYQKYGVQAQLSYNYQGKYIEDLRDNAVDKWVQPTKSLDFHSRYTFSRNVAVDFDVANILDGHRYYTTKGESPSYQKDYMEPGRTFMLKVTYQR